MSQGQCRIAKINITIRGKIKAYQSGIQIKWLILKYIYAIIYEIRYCISQLGFEIDTEEYHSSWDKIQNQCIGRTIRNI